MSETMLEAENRSMKAAIRITVEDAVLGIYCGNEAKDCYLVPKIDIYRLANFLERQNREPSQMELA